MEELRKCGELDTKKAAIALSAGLFPRNLAIKV
jgi:hypothetical protein